MSSPPPPQRGWHVDTTKDTKTQLAQRIFNSLVQDALSKLAFDTHDAEARRRVRSAASGSGKSEVEGVDKPTDGSNEDDARPSDPTKDSTSAESTAAHKSGGSGSVGGSVVATPAYANPLIRCMVCNRHVSSNRFAPHLAKCMGLGANNVSSKSGNGGLKRKAAVGAATAAALAAAASGSGGGSGSGSQSGIPSKRGRPPKSRGGTGSARSTATPVPGLGHKEGSAAP